MDYSTDLFDDFDEAYEIVPERIYQIVAQNRNIRIYVTRVLQGSRYTWYAYYDEAVYVDSRGEPVWRALHDVPHVSGSPATAIEALRSAVFMLKQFLER